MTSRSNLAEANFSPEGPRPRRASLLCRSHFSGRHVGRCPGLSPTQETRASSVASTRQSPPYFLMNYHLALGKSWDFAAFDRDARAAKGPRHVLWTLAQRLGAEVHMPGGDPI